MNFIANKSYKKWQSPTRDVLQDLPSDKQGGEWQGRVT